MKIKKRQYQLLVEKLGEKLFDLANIIAGTMVFGQFISEKDFNNSVLIGGIILVIGFYLVSGYILVFLRR